MDESIRRRCLDMGHYMLRHSATVRSVARAFGLSKSSVHKDLTQRLPHIHPALARQVSVLMRYNKSVRHIRGGMATKRKYQCRHAASSGASANEKTGAVQAPADHL